MLLEGFYRINQLTVTEDQVQASILLNSKHDVYKGHFPGQAVVPGVIQLQMVKEILEEHTKQRLFMGTISQVKYLHMIDPSATPRLTLSLQYKKNDEDGFLLTASITYENMLFTRVKAAMYPML